MAQPVDPFIPISPRHTPLQQRPLAKPAVRTPQSRVGNDTLPTSPRSVPSPPSHSAASHPPEAQRAIPAPQPARAQTRQRKERRWPYYAKLALACLVMLAVGSLAQIAVAGEILIGIYAVWALVTKVPSRTTFLLALGTFGAILLLLIIRPDQVLMRNFATYAFLFLLVGALSLAREARL